jgi:hypothetical protein
MDARLMPVVVLVWSVSSCCGWVFLTFVLRRCSLEILTVLHLKDALLYDLLKERKKVAIDGSHVDMQKDTKLHFRCSRCVSIVYGKSSA